MNKIFSFSIIFFLFSNVLTSQIVVNGTFGSGTASWGCSPETNPESVYGGPTGNTVAEVDAAASLCQTITGLTIGGVYRLSYQCSRRVGGCPSPNPTNITITVSGGVLSKADSRTNTTYALTTTTYIFTASATSHVITFAAGPGFGGSTCGMIMDNISVVLSPLPIELLYFNAASIDRNTVLTSWETATELYNDFFTLEKSNNSLDWETLATIDGAGNSTQMLAYQYIDNAPYPATSYYRLKQTDFDGTYTYSLIQSVQLAKKQTVSIYPNPSMDHHLKINSDVNFPYNVNLYNNLGEIVYTSPNHLIEDLNFNMVDAGIYYLSISKNDEIVFRNKIVLQ